MSTWQIDYSQEALKQKVISVQIIDDIKLTQIQCSSVASKANRVELSCAKNSNW